jgi:AbrB family looped-hinge helix DNA binding protein
MKIATISSKGQITIPKNIQASLQVTHGSKVVLYADRNILMIKPLKNSIVEQTAGSLQQYIPKNKRAIPFSQVKEVTQSIVAKQLAEK